MSYKNKILYVSLNLGCSGSCKLCPTRNTVGCSKITVEDLIDWKKFEEALENSKAEYVCLIGGENPFKNCGGHRNIYFHLHNRVKAAKKELYAVCSYEGTNNTDMLTFFDKLLLYVPRCWKEQNLKVLNTLYIKSYVNIQTFVQTDKVSDSWLSEVRKEFFVNPTILLESEEERKKIQGYLEKYGDFKFAGSILQRNSPVYSLTENRYCGRIHTHGNRNKPWRTLLGMDD